MIRQVRVLVDSTRTLPARGNKTMPVLVTNTRARTENKPTENAAEKTPDRQFSPVD